MNVYLLKIASKRYPGFQFIGANKPGGAIIRPKGSPIVGDISKTDPHALNARHNLREIDQDSAEPLTLRIMRKLAK